MKEKKIVMASLLALFLLSCGGGGGRPSFGDNEYPVAMAESGTASLQTTYPAVMKGVQDVQISPKVSGFITRINVKEGQRVSAGTLLFELDNATFQAAVRQAEAAVNTARTAVSTQELTFENTKLLHSSGVVGDYELETSANTLASARAGLSQAEAALANAREQLSFCFVKSPASGVVGTLPLKKGALVNTSSVLTTVSDDSEMEAYFSVNEKDALSMGRVGGGLETFPAVKLQLADGSMYGYEGRVTKMSGVIDQGTGTVQMIALFANPDRLLKSGASGKIVIPSVNSSAIIIPQGCVMEVQNKKFVYVLGGDNKVKYTEITVDAQNDGNNYIVTGGLSVGEKYVTNGVTKLTDGMEIVPITPERYQQKIDEQAKAMTAGDIVETMTK